jgi:hypothetical protein
MAVVSGLWSVYMVKARPFSIYRKWRIPRKQARSSLSNAEYLTWCGSSFFEKKASSSHPAVPGR